VHRVAQDAEELAGADGVGLAFVLE
jgi:hypothetical protein